MKKLLVTTIGVFAFSFCSFSQTMGEKLFNYMQECSCNEILMIAGGFEKKYTGIWLENLKLRDGFIEFSKGQDKYIHRWNPDKVVYIEKGASYIRVYLEQTK